MKAKGFILVFILFGIVQMQAQDSLCFNKQYVAKNNVSIELVGMGGFSSLNYERNFCMKGKSYHTVSLGASYIDDGVSIPLSYKCAIGKKKHKFIFGTGATILIYPDHADAATIAKAKKDLQRANQIITPLFNYWLFPITAGYEFVSKKRIYLKIYASPVINRVNFIYYSIFPWGGFTFGLKLNGKKKA